MGLKRVIDAFWERRGAVVLDDAAAGLLDRALDLAAEGRADDGAVSELRSVANGNLAALEAAARGARQDNEHLDDAETHLAHRLLQAAITREPVAELTSPERERLEVFEEFAGLATEQQRQLLIAKQPALEHLEGDARAHRFGSRGELLALKSVPSAERRGPARALVQKQEMLERELRRLVGPDSGNSDVLLGSRPAYAAAFDYLIDLPDRAA